MTSFYWAISLPLIKQQQHKLSHRVSSDAINLVLISFFSWNVIYSKLHVWQTVLKVWHNDDGIFGLLEEKKTNTKHSNFETKYFWSTSSECILCLHEYTLVWDKTENSQHHYPFLYKELVMFDVMLYGIHVKYPTW